MAFYKLHNIQRSETNYHYGYQTENREDGVYADIPDELVEFEIAAGRVRVPKPVVEVPEVPVEVVKKPRKKRTPKVEEVAEMEVEMSDAEVKAVLDSLEV